MVLFFIVVAACSFFFFDGEFLYVASPCVVLANTASMLFFAITVFLAVSLLLRQPPCESD
jgi:hypothetical protein